MQEYFIRTVLGILGPQHEIFKKCKMVNPFAMSEAFPTWTVFKDAIQTLGRSEFRAAAFLELVRGEFAAYMRAVQLFGYFSLLKIGLFLNKKGGGIRLSLRRQQRAAGSCKWRERGWWHVLLCGIPLNAIARHASIQRIARST